MDQRIPVPVAPRSSSSSTTSGSAAAARSWAKAFAAAAAAVVLSWLLMQMDVLKRMSLQVNDLLAIALAPKQVLNDVLVVDVDEESMAKLRPQLGEWPYGRAVYGRTTEFLRAAHAKAIVFDILFSEERLGDEEFARALAATPSVALASASIYRNPERDADYHKQLAAVAWPVQTPPPSFLLHDITLPRSIFTAVSSTHIGVIRVVPDDDGRLRRVPLMHRAYEQYLPSLPVAALFTGQPKPPVAFDQDAKEVAIGNKVFPVNASGEVLLKFPQDLNSIDVLPFYQLVAAIDGREAIEPIARRVRDKRVFIGSSTAVLGDRVLSLYGEIPGVLALAAATGMMDRGMLLRPPHWAIELLLLAVAIAIPLLTFRGYTQRSPWMSLATSAVSVCAIIALAAIFYLRNQSTGVLFPVLTTLFIFAALNLLRLAILFRERQRLAMEKMAAEQAYDLKSRFISQMTHELRTPLAAIMGFNKLLAEPGVAEKYRDDYSKVIAKNSDHLMTIINNMLDQSKLEAGQLKINRAPARVRELVDDVVTSLSTLARDKHLTLQASYADGLPSVVEVDAFRLRQILINLVGNAIKFTSEGGVTINADWTGDHLKLVVLDSGPGIPESALQRIFEPFRQGTDSIERVYGGTGLGLGISRTLCELMGGRLEVESTLGKGSVFFVTVPARICAPETLQSDVPAPSSLSETLHGHVLLADDNQDIRELVSRYLSRMGLQVLTAKDGADALSKALANPIDLVLMDMEMPILRGSDAVARLRASGFVRPILALTAHPEGPEVEQALRDGCDGYIAKPVNRERLFTTLRSLLAPKTPPT